MKEHGLLFSAPMIRARAAGLKTQTRRIITKANSNIDGHGSRVPYKGKWENFDFNDVVVDRGPSPAGNPGPYLKVALKVEGIETRHRFYPRIQPGDRIWWKETWVEMHTDSMRPYPELQDGRPVIEGNANEEEFHIRVPVYRATDQDYGIVDEEKFDDGDHRTRWNSSMFMPRKYARFIDTVIAVRPERLQDISEEDAIAEGVGLNKDQNGYLYSDPELIRLGQRTPVAREAYADLIDHLHGKGTWNSNPWVWVYTMKIS